jgi:hypothetical protein
MTRRFLALGLAVAVLALGGMSARAGSVGLPTTLDNLTPSGTTTTVGNLEFSNFSYLQVTGTPPPASGVHVDQFVGPPAGETGLEFSGAFSAPAGTTADWKIKYTVTAAPGFLINDAFLQITGGNLGGTGSVSVDETFSNGKGLHTFVTMSGATLQDTVSFDPQTTLTVTKDIFLNGGSNGATVSVFDQAFSVVPEPTSMALLGIGLSGLFTFRRFLKRALVA